VVNVQSTISSPASDSGSALYVGTVRHRRFSPVAHAFTYPLFMVLLDIDRIAESMRVSRVTSYNRWNWASFHDADHFGDPALPLRARLASEAARAGQDLPDGRILLLTHLRYLGYCFNPVSFFYCFDRSAALRLVVAEVHNTFGGAHNYWLKAEGRSLRIASDRPFFYSSSSKLLEVSPFMPSEMNYRFVLTRPGDRLTVHMDVTVPEAADPSLPRQGSGRTFDATLALDRRPWSSTEVHRALVRYPVMTAQVIAGIHWQAWRLWWKGNPVVATGTR
jgi:uncharacterized protein